MVCVLAGLAAAQAPPQSQWEPPGAEKVESLAASSRAAPRDLLTRSELSDYRETGTYAESVEFARKLAQRSPWVRVEKIGITPQGREMILVIVSKGDRAGKAVVFIQNGIHSGEIAGKDATWMLLRDVVINKRFAAWLDHVVLLVLPVFNIDGHEQRSPFNRINQNGPAEMGWRTTAQRLNLNRDYVKADAPEIRAFLKVYTAWLPELLIDNHVTDGVDYRYDLTIGVPTEQEIWPPVGAWSGKLLREVMAALERDGHVVSRYAEPVDSRDFTKGFTAAGASPRYSTVYAATQNRSAVLVETHSLKRYRTRVWAHYDLMRRAVEILARDAKQLKAAALQADREVAQQVGRRIFVDGVPSRDGDPFVFKGLRRRLEKSEVSGATYPVYSSDPEDIAAPLFQRLTATFEPVVPAAYAIPQEWTAVIDLLHAHGIRTERLDRERSADAEVYQFSNVRWAERPFEGRHRLTFKTQAVAEAVSLPRGTVLAPMDQRAARVALHILEPDAPDSAVRWGFFNAIFEQKEYAESYVLEPLAKQMLEGDPKLRAEFEARLKSDPQFAASPVARRQFFYERSPYRDRDKDRYPILRVIRLR